MVTEKEGKIECRYCDYQYFNFGRGKPRCDKNQIPSYTKNVQGKIISSEINWEGKYCSQVNPNGECEKFKERTLLKTIFELAFKAQPKNL